MRRRWSPYPSTLFGAVTALIAAAVLVLYLQRVEAEQHQQQTVAIVEEMCNRTVADAGARLRELLDAPLVVSIASTDKPDVREYNLPSVLTSFTDGLSNYPYVDRFFLWSERMPDRFRDQVLFVSRSGPGQIVSGAPGSGKVGVLGSDPPTGRLIFELAEDLSGLRKSYAVIEQNISGTSYQVVLHFLWGTPLRTKYYGIIGYTVNMVEGPRMLFDQLMQGPLSRALNPDPRLPGLRLTVMDEAGRTLYGTTVRPGVPAATSSVDALFFPGGTYRAYLATRRSPRLWAVAVSAAVPVTAWSVTGYWASGMAVFLILIALLCAVSAARHASRLSRIQTEFVTNVSHQLKTPLSMIMGASETLGLGRVRSPEKIREYAEIVRAQTGRLCELVDQMILFSKTKTELAPRNQPVDVVDLVEASVTTFTRDLNVGEAAIAVDASPDSIVVRGDPDALRQVIVNLLDNAVKYGNGRPNQITVRVDAVADEALISVRDRGIGIDPADVPHIFEKFYRGRGNGRRPPGFGLGLAIVQAIVHAHRGRISVTSEPGNGTEFRVVLPTVSKGRFHAGPSVGR